MRQQSTDALLSEQTTAPTEPVELNQDELQHVAGGINPQPLPPRSDPHAF
jgi:hypothetical protein